MTDVDEEWNILLVRKAAAEHEIHERTVLKALRGGTFKAPAVRKRAAAAVEHYKALCAAEAEHEGDS